MSIHHRFFCPEHGYSDGQVCITCGLPLNTIVETKTSAESDKLFELAENLMRSQALVFELLKKKV